jgi:hypothetical protein
MPGRTFSRRLLYLLWALLLVGGLSFNTAQAEALHSSCQQICEDNCGAGGCKSAIAMGCTCFYRCNGGGSGSAACAL